MLDVLRADYEEHLCAFHERLRDASPRGLRSSLSWRVDGAPWLPGGSGYEDWYLLDAVSNLESIERQAVSPVLESVHEGVASLAEGGIAGLYKPVQSRPPAASAAADSQSSLADARTGRGRVALWFSKPYGESYDAIFAELAAVKKEAAAELWQRMLTLGPTPELSLLQEEAVALPEGWTHLVVRRSAVLS